MKKLIYIGLLLCSCQESELVEIKGKKYKVTKECIEGEIEVKYEYRNKLNAYTNQYEYVYDPYQVFKCTKYKYDTILITNKTN